MHVAVVAYAMTWMVVSSANANSGTDVMVGVVRAASGYFLPLQYGQSQVTIHHLLPLAARILLNIIISISVFKLTQSKKNHYFTPRVSMVNARLFQFFRNFLESFNISRAQCFLWKPCLISMFSLRGGDKTNNSNSSKPIVLLRAGPKHSYQRAKLHSRNCD